MEHLPKQEPIKYRFMQRCYWKMPSEVVFDDDSTEFADRGKDAKRKYRDKPHSHSWGRKPTWRHTRRQARREKMLTDWEKELLTENGRLIDELASLRKKADKYDEIQRWWYWIDRRRSWRSAIHWKIFIGEIAKILEPYKEEES